jgi:hypothetical protein
MQNVDPISRSEASQSLGNAEAETSSEAYEWSSSSGLKLLELTILSSCFLLLTILYCLIAYFMAENSNYNAYIMNSWLFSDTRRNIVAVAIISHSTLLIAKSHYQLQIPYVEIETLIDFLKKYHDRLQFANNNLIGLYEIPSIQGEKEEFDYYNLDEVCSRSSTNSFQNDKSASYACS